MAKKETEVVAAEAVTARDLLEQFKECLSESRFRIKLDDLVNIEIRAALQKTAEAKLPMEGGLQSSSAVDRLKLYEGIIRPLQERATLLGKWATPEQTPTLSKIIVRMADSCIDTQGGSTVWLGLKWYPLSILAYSAGIAAMQAENYGAFKAIHLPRVEATTYRRGEGPAPIIVNIAEVINDMEAGFKQVPGHERNHIASSEYMLKSLQPTLEDLLFLGSSYESLFERYEVLRAWVYADLAGRSWCPVGRFGWKDFGRGSIGGTGPYAAMRAEAKLQRDQWGPIRAGMFSGSYAHFEQVVAKLENEFLKKLYF